MNQDPISGAVFPRLLSGPPEASAAWSAFTIHVLEPPVHLTMTCSDYMLGLQTSGTCRLRNEVGGRSTEGWSGPGCVTLIPAGLKGTWEGRGHVGKSRGIAAFVPREFLSRVLEHDWGAEPRRVEFVPRFLARDPVIDGLLTRLAFEASNGAPSGTVYAESACEFLAHHLIHAHSSLAAPAPSFSGGLSARRLKLVRDYVEENLARSITLRGLAAVAGVSPRHFERAFRQAMGVPPHAYILQRRVTAARDLLVSQPWVAIHEIASQVGFSSSSHLAAAFRRQMGQSPSAFRRSI